jgi:polar amino acid transport system substrate-binding protein
MKHIFYSALIGLAFTSHALADTITLRADTWCPFNCEPDAANKGFVVEIADYALSKKGHKIEYKTLSWTRAVAEVVAGNINGAVAAGDVDVTDNKLIVGKETTGVSVNCVYAKKDSKATYSGSKDMSQFKKVGVVQEYFYGDQVAELQKTKPELFDAIAADDTTGMNIKKLKAGRVDAVMEDEAVMSYVLNKNKEKDVKKIGCEPHRINLFLAFSPKNPKSTEYAAAVDEAIVELRKSGKLKQILAKYGLKDWK